MSEIKLVCCILVLQNGLICHDLAHKFSLVSISCAI